MASDEYPCRGPPVTPGCSNPPVPVGNVLGDVEDQPAPGVVVFEVDGQEHRLTPVLGPGRCRRKEEDRRGGARVG